MTAAAELTLPLPSQIKKRVEFGKKPALGFFDKIESRWKGNEEFAMWLVHRMSPKTTVDLGFDKGLSTLSFAYRNRGHVFGIDWFEAGRYAEKSFALDSALNNISHAIRFNYVKNIHLIIGPFSDVSMTWKKKIDLLHIDSAQSYSCVKQHYENWIRFLNPNGVIWINDLSANPNEAGRFFRELPFPKIILPQGRGLGIASHDEALLNEILQKFSHS